MIIRKQRYIYSLNFVPGIIYSQTGSRYCGAFKKRFVKLRAFFEIQAFYLENYMCIFSEDLVWISVSMICATVVYKQIAPSQWSYQKGEALIGRIQGVAKEQKEKREFQFNLNLPQKKAIHIKLTSAAVLTGALCFSAYVAPGIDMMIISFYSSVHMSLSVCLHALLLKRSPLSFLPVLTGMASSTCGCITRGCGP